MDFPTLKSENNSPDFIEVIKLLDNYIQCVLTKEVSLIHSIFNKGAVMYFNQENKLIELPVFPGLEQYILSTKKDEEATGKICYAEVLQNAAFGKVEVKSKGLLFSDYFTFVKNGNQWLIVSKTFSVSPIQ